TRSQCSCRSPTSQRGGAESTERPTGNRRASPTDDATQVSRTEDGGDRIDRLGAVSPEPLVGGIDNSQIHGGGFPWSNGDRPCDSPSPDFPHPGSQDIRQDLH